MKRMAVLAFSIASMLMVGSSFGQGQTQDIKNLVIIPPAPLKKFQFENKSVVGSVFKFLGGGLGADLTAREAAGTAALTTALNEKNLSLETHLSTAVQQELEKIGFKASVLADLKRSDRWPDWFEYEKLNFDGDAVVQLKFAYVGVSSPNDSPRFIPVIEVDADIALKGQRKTLTRTGTYFGRSASESDREMSVTRNLSMSFASAEELMSNTSALERIYLGAIPKVA